MRGKWWILAGVACGTFMATLDSSIVNIALPTLTQELSSDLARIKWVVIVYLLVITCLLLPWGRLADQYGRRRVFQLGFALFTGGSLACGLSATLGWLLLSRALQGLGASMLMANGPAIITAAFPSRERGKALGTLSMVVSAGLVAGPASGGFLINHWGWRSIFLVNIPVGILGFFLTRKFIPEDPPRKASLPFDWAGALLQFLFFLSMIVVVDPPSISISGGDAISAPRFLMVPLTLLLGWLFIRVESQIKAPLFDLSLLKNRTFWSANLASFLIFVSFSAVTVLMPFYLVELLRLDPSQAGLFMTAIPLTILVVAPISGRLSDRFGGRELSMVGAAIGAISLLIMAGAFGVGLDMASSSTLLIGTLAGLGFSTGLFQSPNNNAIMSVVPPSKLGVASALLATVRNLGLVTGTGLATGIFFWRKQEEGDFVGALHFALAVAGCVAAVAAVISALKPSGRFDGGAESDGQAKG